MNDHLDPSAETGVSPTPTRFSSSSLSIPRGIGIHFDPAAPGNDGSAPSSGAAGAPANGAGSPPAGSGGTSPTPSPESPNIKQLREQYETTKAQLDGYTKLGKPEDLSSAHQTYTKLSGEATTLGMGLGYTEAEIQEAFRLDPVKTLQFLRSEQDKTAGTRGPQAPDFSKLLKEQLDKQLKPIQEREQQRELKEANAIVSREFDAQIKTAFPDGVPSDVGDAIYDVMVGMLEGDKDAFGRLVKEQKASDVQKYFTEAKNRVLKVLTAWSKHETDRVSGNTQRPPGGNTNTNTRPNTPAAKKGWGLERMINGEFPPEMSVSKR